MTTWITYNPIETPIVWIFKLRGTRLNEIFLEISASTEVFDRRLTYLSFSGTRDIVMFGSRLGSFLVSFHSCYYCDQIADSILDCFWSYFCVVILVYEKRFSKKFDALSRSLTLNIKPPDDDGTLWDSHRFKKSFYEVSRYHWTFTKAFFSGICSVELVTYTWTHST